MFYTRTYVPVKPNCIVLRSLGATIPDCKTETGGLTLKRALLLAAALAAAAITTAVAFGAAGTKSADALPQIVVTMDGSSITVTGTLESGAVNIQTIATGSPSGDPIFVRLNPGVTADQFLAAFDSPKFNDPNNVTPYGAIVLDADEGQGTNDVQTILQPGDYVAFDGAANDPSQWPHTTFTIAENGSPQTLPAAQQSQKSIEFGFRGQAKLHTGQVIRASNAGWLVHMDIAFGVKNQTVGHHVIKLLREGKDSAAGKLANHRFFSLFGPVSHGAVQQFVLKAKPGWYVEACFMDTQDGREHVQLGMERLVHVVP